LAPLRDALERLRLEGAIFLRAEYTEGWALAGQGGAAFARMLRPEAERVILFHVLASGRCWVSLADGQRQWAGPGDVIVLPYGDEHLMGGAEQAAPVPITSIVAPPPWEELPIVHHGQGGRRTDVVCGFLSSDDPLFDPGLRALPSVFVVRPPAGPARGWVEASIAHALEESSGTSPGVVSTRPRRGAARHHGAHRCRDRAAGRLRLGGGVQPGLQARPRALAQRVACIPRQGERRRPRAPSRTGRPATDVSVHPP
jgi:hypothetical protein